MGFIESVVAGIVATIICIAFGYILKMAFNSEKFFSLHKIKLKNIFLVATETKINKTKENLEEFKHSTVFFSYRFSEAFPGCRSMCEFNNSKEAAR